MHRICIATLSALMVFASVSAQDLAAKLAAAKSGDTVTLPAGEVKVTELAVPAGVSLKGAGYGKTVLACQGDVALKLAGGNTISGLDITGAGTGVLVQGAKDVTIDSVRLLGNIIGVRAVDAQNVRVVNCVIAKGRIGVSMSKCTSSAVINCTLADNGNMGLNMTASQGCAFFNNLVANSPLGVQVAPDNKDCLVDYNLYMTSTVGKNQDMPMPTVGSWIDISGYDRHSLSANVEFADAAKNDYRPTNAWDWALDRAVNEGWGVGKLGGFEAPVSDIDHDSQLRPRPIPAGAFYANVNALLPGRQPDGKFEIASDEGLKSAGLYDSQGRCVKMLFSLLPLKKGTYNFYAPTRDWKFAPLAAGKYEVRIATSDLRTRLVTSVGNGGSADDRNQYASTGVQLVVFDSKDRPIFCHNWSEGYKQYRAMDEKLQAIRWSIPGCAQAWGACADGKGLLYGLRDADGETMCLVRVNEETGEILPYEDGTYNLLLPKKDFGLVRGLAYLEGKLYIADHAKSKLLIAGEKDLKFTGSIDIKAPLWPVADRQRKILWVLSESKRVIGLDPDGKIVCEFDIDVPGAHGLAAAGNRVAVLGVESGKIHFFDVTDLKAPKPAGTLGTGDGPYGATQPDRFLFQALKGSFDATKTGGCTVAMDSKGNLAVVDAGVKFFDASGKSTRVFTGIWGQYIERAASPGKGQIRLLDHHSQQSFIVDEQTGTWKPEGKWKLPGAVHGGMWHIMRAGGKEFHVVQPERTQTVFICSAQNFVLKPLIAYQAGPGGLTACTSFKGSTDPKDLTFEPVLLGDGKQARAPELGQVIPRLDGELVFSGSFQTIVPFKGINNKGVPRHDWDNARYLSNTIDKNGETVSPYNADQKDNLTHTRYSDFFADGSYVCTVGCKNKPVQTVGNWSGTDLAGFDATGKFRWFQPLPMLQENTGAKVLDDLAYSVSVTTSEIIAVDKDGLMVGYMGVPRQLFWGGMWLDNGHQFTAVKGDGGKHYVVFGNFNDCVMWVMEITGSDKIQRSKSVIEITAAKAQALAALAAPAPPARVKNRGETLVIKKLAAPMKLEGDLDAWRKAVPVPQIVMAPDADAAIKGPADCSAVIRVAHEGGKLYMQVLRFDDTIALHQLPGQFYNQDDLEVAINSFITGVKINLTRVRREGDFIFRDGWFLPGKPLTPQVAPRKITLLDSAANVPERKVFEQMYGVDMSKCRVIVMEMCVPIDKATFEGRKDEKEIPAMTSGSKFMLGIGVADSDLPGSDGTNMIFWPFTHNTFTPKHNSAEATLE